VPTPSKTDATAAAAASVMTLRLGFVPAGEPRAKALVANLAVARKPPMSRISARKPCSDGDSGGVYAALDCNGARSVDETRRFASTRCASGLRRARQGS